MSEYKIESTVPIPESARGRRGKYPFSDMKPGDSFFAAGTSAKNLGTAAYCWAKSHQVAAKYVARDQADPKGARIWRIS